MSLFLDSYQEFMNILITRQVIHEPELIKCNEVESQLGLGNTERKKLYTKDFLLYAKHRSPHGCGRGMAHPGKSNFANLVPPDARGRLLFRQRDIIWDIERRLFDYNIQKSSVDVKNVKKSFQTKSAMKARLRHKEVGKASHKKPLKKH